MTDQTATKSKISGIAPIALLILKILVAVAFAAAAFLKLSGNEKMVTEFGEIGFGQGFRYLTGVLELIGAGLLVVPRTVRFGAALLLCICGGALVAHLMVLHGDLIHVFALSALLVLFAWRAGRN